MHYKRIPKAYFGIIYMTISDPYNPSPAANAATSPTRGEVKKNNIPRILITPGEPAGIGPDLVAKIAQQTWPAELVVITDPEMLLARAKHLDLPLKLTEVSLSEAPSAHIPSTLKIIPVRIPVPAIPGQLHIANAGFVIECLTLATDLCLNNQADALVTGPVQKSVINEAGIAFTGHTEFLAARCQVSQVIMLFVVDSLKVALLTTHLPLCEVPKTITQSKIITTVQLLNSELKNRFGIKKPVILVSGLNPHAGEGGHLGREEIDIIEPALDLLRKENIHVMGPLPADTLFTQKYLHTADAVLAMYHDQALPVVKNIGFDRAVNVTLGLPIIRTSVDHGTALDIAGSKKANAGSMQEAIKLAITLSRPSFPPTKE
jgi:4-hydroxythreonine-4-phosphate dehydrogenase